MVHHCTSVRPFACATFVAIDHASTPIQPILLSTDGITDMQEEILLSTMAVVKCMADAAADGVAVSVDGVVDSEVSLHLVKVLLMLQTARCRRAVQEEAGKCLGRLACVYATSGQTQDVANEGEGAEANAKAAM